MDASTVSAHAQQWFQDLLRCDTSNPPGNEKTAIDYIAKVFTEFKVPFQIVSKSEDRPNLCASINARSHLAPILLSSHVDVVPVENAQDWKVPPFSGDEYSGIVWGRGALDMKYKTAFDMAAMVWATQQKLSRPLKMVALSDEEMGCDFGSRFVLEHHRELVSAEYVLNEVGGFNTQLGTKVFMPIQIGEKSCCQLRVHANALSVHASTPIQNTSPGLIARVITSFEDSFLGYTLTDSARVFFEQVAAAQPASSADLFRNFLDIDTVEQACEQIDDPVRRAQLRAMVCTTIAPTRFAAGFKNNVIPDSAWVDFDCRLIPAIDFELFQKQVHFFLEQLLGDRYFRLKLEFSQFQKGYELAPEDPMVKHLLEFVSNQVQFDWDGNENVKPIGVPFFMPAASDNSHYFAAGMKPIGFAPLIFPEDFPGLALTHGVNERLPLTSFREGLRYYLEALTSLAVLS